MTSPNRRSRSRLLWAAIAAAATVVAGALMAGRAWACVPQPNISLQPRSSGPPGSQLTVAGANFENPVELRWNATDGALLASGLATSFTATPITIPETPDGLYVVVALERGPGGAVGNVARTPVQVARDGAPANPTPSVAAAGDTDDDDESSTAFAAALGVTAGVVLLLTGGLAGATVARRRAMATSGTAG